MTNILFGGTAVNNYFKSVETKVSQHIQEMEESSLLNENIEQIVEQVVRKFSIERIKVDFTSNVDFKVLEAVDEFHCSTAFYFFCIHTNDPHLLMLRPNSKTMHHSVVLRIENFYSQNKLVIPINTNCKSEILTPKAKELVNDEIKSIVSEAKETQEELNKEIEAFNKGQLVEFAKGEIQKRYEFLKSLNDQREEMLKF